MVREIRTSQIGRLIGGLVTIALSIWIWLAWDYEAFLAWKREAGAVPFFSALAIMPAFGFPTTPFYLLVGATFGIALGLVGAALSLAVNLLLCYWIAQSGLRRVLKMWLAHIGYTLPSVWPGHEIKFTLVVKLMPGVPAFLKNYLISLGGVPFLIYFAVSFTVTLAYAAVFILLGESLHEHHSGKATGALITVVLLGIFAWLIHRWLKSQASGFRKVPGGSD